MGEGTGPWRMREEIERIFPGLRIDVYSITSPRTPSYNCVAWAVGQVETWWWPDPMEQAFWPFGIPRRETIDVFIQAFSTLGYVLCATADVEPGFERIAIYVNSARKPTHVARQLPNGTWTSKLGKLEDIEHATLDGLNGSPYGSVALFMRRPIQQQTS